MLENQLIVDDARQGMFLVNKKIFVDSEIFASEFEKIFNKVWLYVGHESEIPHAGDFITRRVAGRPLIYARGQDDAIKVFINSCLHNGALVCREARGNSRYFSCAYHGWVFDNTGNLREVPGEAAFGPNFQKSDYGLRQPPFVDTYKGFTFVCFDPQSTQSLQEFLAGACEYLDLLDIQGAEGMEILPGTHFYSTRANWKMLPVNVIDGNHFFPTHATYLEYLRVMGHDLSQPVKDFNEIMLGNGHTVFEYEAPWGRATGKTDQAWSEETNALIKQNRDELSSRVGDAMADRLAKKNRNLVIFPNLIINDIVGVTVRVCEPLSPDYMEVTAWELAPKGENPKVRAIRTDNFLTFLGPAGFATPDDIEGMETSQKGFASWQEVPWATYSKGMLNNAQGPGNNDSMMRYFWRYWAIRMGVIKPEETTIPEHQVG